MDDHISHYGEAPIVIRTGQGIANVYNGFLILTAGVSGLVGG